MRKCKRCEEAKPLSDFYPKRRKLSPDGFSNICKVCSKIGAIEWYTANKKRAHKNSRSWYLRNKDKQAICVANWASRNKPKLNAATVERRRLKGKAKPSWANDFFIEEIYDLARLRTKITGKKWHVDHIVPINSEIVCGLHAEQNLRVIPAFSNLSKGNKHWPDMP